LIYVTDSGGDRVEAIDPTADKVVQVIGGIALPHAYPTGFVGEYPDNAIYRLSLTDREGIVTLPWG
jgi:hypothetical protein